MRFHLHNGKHCGVISSEQYKDISFGDEGIAQTRVLYWCERCECVYTKVITGYWTLAQLRAQPDN